MNAYYLYKPDGARTDISAFALFAVLAILAVAGIGEVGH